jgi:glycosyltransferase involved in cell wall biosynthesis
VQDSNAVLDPDIQEMDLCTVFSSESENFDARMYWRVWRHLNEHEYDVIHTHQNFSGAIGRIIAEMRNIPVVNTEHNDIQHFTLPQRLINAATFGLPKANIYNSRSTKKSCGSVEWHFSRCDEIIYNGIDIDRISKSGETQYSTEFQDNILITNVVVMTQQKNQHMILRTVRRIKHCSEITGVHFSIVGTSRTV